MAVDQEESASLIRQLDLRHSEWESWQPANWVVNDENLDALMRRAGSWAPSAAVRTSWSTPMSMRDVDAECRGVITNWFALVDTDLESDGDFE